MVRCLFAVFTDPILDVILPIYRKLETYSDPSQTSKMALFAKIVNGLAVHYFREKLHLRCLTGF